MGDGVRLVLRGVGQLLVTAGVIVALYIVYAVYVTNFFAERKQHDLATRTEQQWRSGRDVLLPLPGSSAPTVPVGDGVADLYIPRLGRDYHYFIVQGSEVPDDAQLEQGPAHYGGTALPGQVGNFSVAGHRVGKGEPFLNLDKLRPGDPVVVETKSAWFVYRVKGLAHGLEQPDADGIPGRQIVDPGDGQVVSPVPDDPSATPTEKLMTMTTCTPKFTATQRMVVHAVLDPGDTVRVRADAGSAVLRMPASIAALYTGEEG